MLENNRINCWLNKGDLSLEYFHSHIPEHKTLRNWIRENYTFQSKGFNRHILTYIAEHAGIEKNDYISHVDTYLNREKNLWRVQVRIRIEAWDIYHGNLDNEAKNYLMETPQIKSTEIINNVKESFMKIEGNITFWIPFIEKKVEDTENSIEEQSKVPEPSTEFIEEDYSIFNIG